MFMNVTKVSTLVFIHPYSVSGKELIVYGGVDSEDAELCTTGLYGFDTGEM